MATLKADPGFVYFLKGDNVQKDYRGQFPIAALADLLRQGKLASAFIPVGDDWVQLQLDGSWVPAALNKPLG